MRQIEAGFVQYTTVIGDTREHLGLHIIRADKRETLIHVGSGQQVNLRLVDKLMPVGDAVAYPLYSKEERKQQKGQNNE